MKRMNSFHTHFNMSRLIFVDNSVTSFSAIYLYLVLDLANDMSAQYLKVVDTARVPGLFLTEFYAPFWFA